MPTIIKVNKNCFSIPRYKNLELFYADVCSHKNNYWDAQYSKPKQSCVYHRWKNFWFVLLENDQSMKWFLISHHLLDYLFKIDLSLFNQSNSIHHVIWLLWCCELVQRNSSNNSILVNLRFYFVSWFSRDHHEINFFFVQFDSIGSVYRSFFQYLAESVY